VRREAVAAADNLLCTSGHAGLAAAAAVTVRFDRLPVYGVPPAITLWIKRSGYGMAWLLQNGSSNSIAR